MVLSSLTTSQSTPAGYQSGHPGQVDRRFGVPGPLQDAPRAVAEGQDVPGAVEVGGAGVGIGQRADGGRPVGGRDPRGGAVPVIDVTVNAVRCTSVLLETIKGRSSSRPARG